MHSLMCITEPKHAYLLDLASFLLFDVHQELLLDSFIDLKDGFKLRGVTQTGHIAKHSSFLVLICAAV